jgi:hypothetical protein
MGTSAEGSEWRTMADADQLTLQVCPGPDDEAEDLAELAARLGGELLDLEVAAVEPLERGSLPPGAKGAGAVFGWLAVNLGPAALQAVLARVADWATRNGRTVEVTDGGDTLKLGQATREQQERIIDAWLARHPAGS